MSEGGPNPSRSSPRVVLLASPRIFSSNDQTHPLQDAISKTTHIVIHDPATATALINAGPLTPQTPGTSTLSPFPLLLSQPTIVNNALTLPADKKYNWDPSVLDQVLPVRCRNIRGELHKSKFGSGGRGRCIFLGEEWYTPSEFEALCGRGNSKDWKRSIRYGGRSLQCLIEEGFLQPHATSCTCSTCCDNNAVAVGGSSDSLSVTSGPVRLFTPYKRRKKLEKKPSQDHPSASSENSTVDAMVVSLPISDAPQTPDNLQVLSINSNLIESPRVGGLSINLGNACPDSVIVTPAATPQTPRSAPTAQDFAEQRQWWQLEEMVKNLVRQAQDLQKQIETAKLQSISTRETVLQQLRVQMENEKKEALNTSRVEAQMNLSRAILEVKTEKEMAIEQALEQARLEMQKKFENIGTEKGEILKRCTNCDREAFSECTGCHRVSYCGIFCQRKDWQNHQDDCGDPNTIAHGSESVEELSES